MKGLRYKAYISYAHSDESWAVWLQRALEGFRVPARLQSAGSDHPLPKRLAPVFRDREDLSSASDLSSSLRKALQESEALIVVCSPAAAASRWVNEEIRHYQSLGRAERVFCVIVDGDPGDRSGPANCFPPALFDGVDDAPHEPLAADPRKYADGKRLALLKIAAGMLGVRLDELRRRDLLRRRRLQALGAVAATIALVLAASAWRSSVAERQEREKAEQMAGFIVDLVEDLSSELDLESLSRMSSKALEYWNDLDPEKLSPGTRIKVGLALRQLGQISEQQGRSDEALDHLQRSLRLLRNLHEQRPDLQEAEFELGQAAFWVGNYYNNRGDQENAERHFEEYADVSRALYESDPDNEVWLLELSYAVTGAMALKLLSGEPQRRALLDEAAEAVAVAKRVLAGQPRDPNLQTNYSTTLAWAADALMADCDLLPSLALREERLTVARRALAVDPSNNGNQEEVAYSHTGLASASLALGRPGDAEAHLVEAIEILERQSAGDPTNRNLRRRVLERQVMLAEAMIAQGKLPQAGVLLESVFGAWSTPEPREKLNATQIREVVNRQLVKADWHERLGRVDAAREALVEARALSDRLGPLDQHGSVDRANRVLVEFGLWRLAPRSSRAAAAVPLEALQRTQQAGYLRSCNDVLADAMLALMEGREEAAGEQLRWLEQRGYASRWVKHLQESFSVASRP